MARIEDIPQPTRDAVANLVCQSFDTTPFVAGPPLAERRVAIVSSAALIRRGDTPFPFGSPEVRFLPADVPPSELLISHVSINFDRSGYQRDINTVYPMQRLGKPVDHLAIGSAAPPTPPLIRITKPGLSWKLGGIRSAASCARNASMRDR